jgi:hypothetical protein
MQEILDTRDYLFLMIGFIGGVALVVLILKLLGFDDRRGRRGGRRRRYDDDDDYDRRSGGGNLFGYLLLFIIAVAVLIYRAQAGKVDSSANDVPTPNKKELKQQKATSREDLPWNEQNAPVEEGINSSRYDPNE